MKPIIGITCNYDPRDTVIGVPGLGLPGQDWEFLAADYIYTIEKAGGIPTIIPYCREKKNIIALLEKVDGILISGGHDIDPLRYGARPMPYCGRIVPERDEYDLTIFHYGYEHKLPMLGICRGIQIMNVAMGGTVYQDLGQEAHLTHRYMGDMAPMKHFFLQVPFSIQFSGIRSVPIVFITKGSANQARTSPSRPLQKIRP